MSNFGFRPGLEPSSDEVDLGRFEDHSDDPSTHLEDHRMVVGRLLASDLGRAFPVHLSDPVHAFHVQLVRAEHVGHRLEKNNST